MDDGVLHQGLQHHLGHDAVLEPLVHVDLAHEPVLEPDLLDVQVLPHQLQLVLQRDQLAAGDAGPQQRRQIRGHIRDLGDVVGHAQPLHAVQRVVQEVGVQLGLQHPQLRLVQLPLALDGALQILAVFLGHAVEAGGQTPKLIGAVQIQLDVVVALLHLPHGVVQRVDGPGQIAAEPPCRHGAQRQTQKAQRAAHQIQGAQHLPRVDAGLLEQQREAGGTVGGTERAVVALAAGELLPGQQLAAQSGHGILGLHRAGVVHRAPGAVQHQQIVGGCHDAVKKPGKAAAGHTDGDVAQQLAAVARDGADRQQAGVAAEEHGALAAAGGVQCAPVRVQRGGQDGVGAVQADALRVVDVHVGVGPQRGGPAVQKLVQQTGILSRPAQGAAGDGAGGQRLRRVAVQGGGIGEAGAQRVQRVPALLGLGVLCTGYDDLHHHHVAQQQRHQRGHQNGGKHPVAEGAADPVLQSHAASSAVRLRQMASSSA